MASATQASDSVEGPARFGKVLRNRAFAVLYSAESTSLIGDQLARVALAVLVFDRTGNAAATALTYATTFLPAIFGGVLVGGLGDRMSRRAVLVGCDLVRAALFALMALPGLPIWTLLVFLVAAVFLEPAFAASEVSYLADALGAEDYRAATGLRMITNQAAQVAGFGVGGVLVAALAPRGALIVDAATFLVSGVLIAFLLRAPQAPIRSEAQERTLAQPMREVWRSGELRFLILFSLLAAFFIVPEGLAVPFGHYVAASVPETGVLLAAIPLGGALGAVLLVRVVPTARRASAAVLMVSVCGLPLVLSALAPPWPVAFGLWFLSGIFTAYQVEINSAAVGAMPERARAKWVGMFSSALLGAQGVGLVVFGQVAQWTNPGWSIAIAGGAASLGALLIARAQRAARASADDRRYDEAPAGGRRRALHRR